MKKFSIVFTALVALALTFISWKKATQMDGWIGDASLTADGAAVYSGFNCGIGGGSVFPGFILTTQSHTTVSSSGQAMLTCTGDIPAGFEPQTAVVLNGGGCNTQGGFTTNTSRVYRPSGSVVLKCNVD